MSCYAESMSALRLLSDHDLLARLPLLVQTERRATAEVIEHLVEVERRRLYLDSCSSLYRYCIDTLGYAEDAALKRHRVAKLALRVPQVLDELRAGTMHLTGLFLLSTHLTQENAGILLAQARRKTRRELERLIAHWFPRPDVEASITCSGADNAVGSGRLEPLSPARVRVEFTARVEVLDKVEKARQLLSHALPSGDLGELFERALDALVEKESRKRFGSGKSRKPRQHQPEEHSEKQRVECNPQKTGQTSRYVPVDIQRAVWERDGSQCAFVGVNGHRCNERQFLTIEHRMPFALGGPPKLENLCLLCSAHNLENARRVFGALHVEAKINQQKALAALCHQGFQRRAALAAITRAIASEPDLDLQQLLRKSLLLLVPAAG